MSQRWVQIERTLRAKRELAEEKEEIEEETFENLEQGKTGGVTALVKEKGRENVEMFNGLIIPKKPVPPADDGAFYFSVHSPSSYDNRSGIRVLHVGLCNLRL